MTQFKEHETWDLESYLGVNKSDHNLEDQIDSLIDQIKLFLNDQSDKNSFIEDYNNWIQERKDFEKINHKRTKGTNERTRNKRESI